MLLINNDFIFLHIPRTGGRFSRLLFSEYCDVKEISIDEGIGKHMHKGIDFIPKEYKGYRIITFVRDPFTWYRSKIHNTLYVGFNGMRQRSKVSEDTLLEMIAPGDDGLYSDTIKKMGLWNNPDVEYYAFENICETLSKLIDVPVEVIQKRKHFGASSGVTELSDRIKDLISTKDSDLIIFHKQLCEDLKNG